VIFTATTIAEVLQLRKFQGYPLAARKGTPFTFSLILIRGLMSSAVILCQECRNDSVFSDFSRAVQCGISDAYICTLLLPEDRELPGTGQPVIRGFLWKFHFIVPFLPEGIYNEFIKK
jgi:hypothetical protein